MVSTLAHIVVGLSIYLLLTFKYKLNFKALLFAAFVLIIPDFDFFVSIIINVLKISEIVLTEHRMFFHNILFFVCVILFYHFYVKKKLISTRIFIALLVVHFSLDFFNFGVPLLAPFSLYYFHFSNITSGGMVPFPISIIWTGNPIFMGIYSILFFLILMIKLKYLKKKCKIKDISVDTSMNPKYSDSSY